MASAEVQLADAIVADLASATFSVAIMPARRLLPVRELDEFGTDLHVTVIPRLVEPERMARGVYRDKITIDVGVQKRLGSDTEADAAAIIGVAKEIAVFLRDRSPPTMATAKYVSQTIVLYMPDDLDQWRLVTSVVAQTYVV
jgi:hypothetical protein